MSKLSFRSNSVSPVKITVKEPVPTTHHILLESTVCPVGVREYKQTHVQLQADALKSFRKEGKDIFEMNETRKITSAGTLLYQTTETYGTSISIESMIEKMSASDLTLRANFKRPGIHSNTTCMEVSVEVLRAALQLAPDTHGHKTVEIHIAAERGAKVPRHGAMYVSVSQKGTQHYLSHIDYKIMASYDAMFHE
jgi:hypothetical protein